MSHVVSSQPSSTSPYQPTEIQETTNGKNPRMSATLETGDGQNDCCFRADKSQGCFVYYCCSFFAGICGGIRSCTESCCDCCADCLIDCCEDDDTKAKRNRRNRYSPRSVAYNGYDDNTWVVGATQHHTVDVGSDEPPYTAPDYYTSNTDAGVHRSSGHHTSTHDTNVHHSVCHDTGHNTSNHNTGHHSSSHDTGHHSSSHDTGGNYDSGTCDTGYSGGGGDSGGGCDSGGGGDSGGGTCD